MPRRFVYRLGHLSAAVLVLILCASSFAYPYHAEEVHNGGTISGFVKYGSVPPKPAPLAITKDRDVCGTTPEYDPSLLVGNDRGIANAVVTITDITQGEPLRPLSSVTFDQKQCEYIPHVAVFPAGSTVVILNSDGILHNIHTESVLNPAIDLAQPGFKKEIRATVKKPEIIKVTCDAHNWMEGWWYVTANPYYAITDAKGHYAIHNVPAGTYTLRVWQERLGSESHQVVVKPDSVTAADFTLKPAHQQRS